MSDQQTNSTSDWQKRKLGALWRREGKNQNYLAGQITLGEFGVENTYKVVIYTNKYKDQNENSPDFIIYQSKPPSEEGSSPEAQPTAESTAPTSEEVAEEVPDLLQ